MPFEPDPLWYKDALIYQLHVRSFADSDDDGVGDFQGLTEKLDYLQDLGVTAIWLLPFYPSPLRDDGYDIANYTDVHPMYGTLDDFRAFLDKAHQHDLRVITELVINHTSMDHPWFQRARRAPPDSSARSFYMWSDTPDRYQEARIIFKDFEFSNWAWDPVARAYYWHRFYSHQPDLNFDNPDVQEEIFKILDFWLGMGVDGLRLDAIPYLYAREGTNSENLPETHTFLKKLRAYADAHYADRMFLAEANQWPEDAVAYFGDGDECHMAFHFPLMPRMFIAIRMEDRFPITETLNHTPAIPQVSQWALFLRNHDELTLEMVTAEERSFMYRVYARNPRARVNLGIRRRLAPLLQNDRRQIELLNSLLFSLPGTPVIYYGDEIGMGDNIYLGDRDGVRTPMQWSHERNAGFSRANPQRIYLPVIIDPEYHYEAVNVETQQHNPYSLLHWTRQLIATRKTSRAFSRGSLQFLAPDNQKVLAFLRHDQGPDRRDRDQDREPDELDEPVLVVANLSRFVQSVELDLAAFAGRTPVEMSGQTRFPPIGELPYFLTMGPYGFYWFVLEHQPEPLRQTVPVPWKERVPTLTIAEDWTTVFSSGWARARLAEILPDYLKQRRWFGGKHRTIQRLRILETIPIPILIPTPTPVGASSDMPSVGYVTLVQVEYPEGDQEAYVLPLTFASGEQAAHIEETRSQVIATRLRFEKTGEAGILYDALRDTHFAVSLLESIAQHRTFRGSAGEIMTYPTRSFLSVSEARIGEVSPHIPTEDVSFAPSPPPAPPTEAAEETPGNTSLAPTTTSTSPVATADQSSTTVVYGEAWTLKCFRRVETGVNPELEIGRFLTEKVSPARTLMVHGAIEYVQKNTPPITLGVLHAGVANQGTAWHDTQNQLLPYIERVLAHAPFEQALPLPAGHLLDLASGAVPSLAQRLIGPYLDTARLLGQRTAELHMALSQETDDPNFVPEPFTDFFQRPFYHTMIGLMDRTVRMLQKQLDYVPPEVREDARRVLAHEPGLRSHFQPFRDRKITAMRIRCHGNYHLEQILCTGEDFVITDFEGDSSRSLDERRIKVSPLRDVASMLRSFHYAVALALQPPAIRPHAHSAEAVSRPIRLSWVHFWWQWVSVAFLQTYLENLREAPLLLQTREETQVLLDAYLLEHSFYELGYELHHRPEQAEVPLQGIGHILGILAPGAEIS
ncbi:MAG: maltose alpha-D-glucosyltransferase [Chloroflexaceae bacterium]|nr:maltose alpha-D-glucosyltransferase [Chloroflexaceae bacterium]